MSLPLCAGLPCPSPAFCGACELGKLGTSIDLASPGSSPSRVSVWSYAVTLTPFAMPLLPWRTAEAEGLINRLKTIKCTIRQRRLRTP